MRRKKTKKKKIKMKGGVDVRELLKNALKSGGLTGVGIKPLETNKYTEIAGYLDTIEADTYNSDEYWILRALTLGLSNVNRYISTRNKTFFKIHDILNCEDLFNENLKEILTVLKNSKSDNSIDPWQKWLKISQEKYDKIKTESKNKKTFQNFLYFKTGIDNIDTLWNRIKCRYYCDSDNFLTILKQWNSLQDQTPLDDIRENEEREDIKNYLQEIEQCYGLNKTSSNVENPETLEKCLSIGFNSDMPPTFPTTGCPAPRALPTTGQWDREIDELAQQFVESINSENMELLNEIFNERPLNRARDRGSTRTTNRYAPYSGGKKKKKSNKKKKTRKKSKKRR